MNNIQIIKQLLNGYYLSDDEIKQAEKLIQVLTNQVINLKKNR